MAGAAAAPYVIGGVVIAAVAAGAYCYLNGIPAPIAETLGNAGLGVATQHGMKIAAPQLAAALIILGAAGYIAYRFYRDFESLWADFSAHNDSNDGQKAEARDRSEAAFGQTAWASFGDAAWSGLGDVGTRAAELASEAADALGRAGNAAGKWRRTLISRLIALLPVRRRVI